MIHLFSKTQSKISTIIAAFNSGSRVEKRGKFNAGISHMLEHCIFKGTEKRVCDEIMEEVSLMGGYINAYTSHETVAYFLQLPYDNLEKGIELLSDMVLNSTIPDEEFDKEKRVVTQEEASSYDDIDGFMYNFFSEVFYPNYLSNPVIGNDESIEKFTAEEVRRFYKKHCSQDRLVVGVSSNCTKKDAMSLMSKYFGKPNGRIKKKLGFKQVEKYGGLGDILEITRPGLEHTYVWVAFPGVGRAYKNLAHVHVLEKAIGGGMDSRLFKSVREDKGLVYSIYANSVSFETGGAFKICFSCVDENVSEVLEIIAKEVEKIKEEALTDRELLKIKNVKRTAYYSQIEDGYSMIMNKIMNKMYGTASVDEYDKSLQETTVEDVLECAKQIFSSQPLVVICRGEDEQE